MNNAPFGSPPGSFGPPLAPGGPTQHEAQIPSGQPSPQGYGPPSTPQYGQQPPAHDQAFSQQHGSPPFGPPPAAGYGAPPVAGYGPPAGGYGLPSNAQVAPPHFGYAQQPFGAPAHGYSAQGYSMAQPPASTGAPSLRWVVFGSFAGAILFGVLGVAIGAASSGEEPGTTIGTILTGLSIPLFATYFITGLVWLYSSWAMLPEALRVTGNGTRVSPGGAIGYLFIPFYNLYWYFVCSVGLCTALNRALEAYGSPKRASSGLALTAAILQVIPYVNLALAPFAWIAFMFSVESAKREYARVASGAPPY